MNEITAEVKTIDADMAQRLLANNPYEFQRKLRPHTVNKYAADMVAGEWDEGSDIELVSYKDNLHLVNGQHRLHAVIQSGKPQVFTLKTVRVHSESELAHRYYTADTGAKRTFTETMSVTGLKDSMGIGLRDIQTTKAAAIFVFKGFANTMPAFCKRQFSPPEQLRITEFWKEEAVEFFTTIAGRNQKLTYRMRNAAVAGVALVTFKYQCSDAKRFWGAAADNDGLHDGDPIKTLVDLLYTHDLKSQGYPVLARRVAACWSNFFEEKKLAYTSVRNATRPIHIAGTPFLESREILGMGLDEIVKRKKGK